MAYLSALIGGLFGTWLFSRALLWLMEKWNGGYRRLIVAHMGSLALFILGGNFGTVYNIAVYTIPQLVWFAFDVGRLRGSPRPKLEPGAYDPKRPWMSEPGQSISQVQRGSE